MSTNGGHTCDAADRASAELTTHRRDGSRRRPFCGQ